VRSAIAGKTKMEFTKQDLRQSSEFFPEKVFLGILRITVAQNLRGLRK
jgi:hypothetical protein